MANFQLPEIQVNPSGWGPCTVPQKFKDKPYQPFSKGDRLGKVADWMGSVYQDRRYVSKYSSQFGGGQQYAYFHDEDEHSFQLIDYTKTQKPMYQRNQRFRFNQQRLRRQQQLAQQRGGVDIRGNFVGLKKGQQAGDGRGKTTQQQQRGRWGGNRGWGQRRWDQRGQQKTNREASVQVKDDWEIIEEMDFPRLSKLKYFSVGDAEDILTAGGLMFYDKSYDKINTKTEKPLIRSDKIFHTVTTTDDPIIRKLAREEVGTVFATDAVLVALMCATRSHYSWDILVQKIGSRIFLDKREHSDLDLLTVNETAAEPPNEDKQHMNSPGHLAVEATYINHNFSQQVVRGTPHRMARSNPFIEEADDAANVASVAYRYRKWNLGGGVVLVARCEHDAVLATPSGDLQYGLIRCLNDWDTKASGSEDWRAKLDMQRTAVLATELKNNSYKLAKWTLQALLGGSEFLRLGYVSRVHTKDSSKHVILAVQQFNPRDFASQINLHLDNAWGILRCVVDICAKQKDGKYLILKDPNKPVVRLYDIPDDTFESDSSDGEDDNGASDTE